MKIRMGDDLISGFVALARSAKTLELSGVNRISGRFDIHRIQLTGDDGRRGEALIAELVAWYARTRFASARALTAAGGELAKLEHKA